jgi:hypothetical protein
MRASRCASRARRCNQMRPLPLHMIRSHAHLQTRSVPGCSAKGCRDNESNDRQLVHVSVPANATHALVSTEVTRRGALRVKLGRWSSVRMCVVLVDLLTSSASCESRQLLIIVVMLWTRTVAARLHVLHVGSGGRTCAYLRVWCVT